jgi:hypothetical protein
MKSTVPGNIGVRFSPETGGVYQAHDVVISDEGVQGVQAFIAQVLASENPIPGIEELAGRPIDPGTQVIFAATGSSGRGMEGYNLLFSLLDANGNAMSIGGSYGSVESSPWFLPAPQNE